MMVDPAKSWTFLEQLFVGDGEDIISVKLEGLSGSSELKEAVAYLTQPGVSSLLIDWLIQVVFHGLSCKVSPEFWSRLEAEDAGVEQLYDAFNYLHDVYTQQYIQADERLQWILQLAASAQIEAPGTHGVCQMGSAFTPVSVAPDNKTKTVHFPVSLAETSLVTPKNGGLTTEEIMQESLEMIPQTKDSIVVEDMDGSYLPSQPTLIETSSVGRNNSNIGISHQGEDLYNLKTPIKNNLVVDLEDDDDESFIRSPIGGNIKLMSALRLRSAASSSTVPARGLSQTSTPGLIPASSSSHTPGPLTPIIAADSSPMTEGPNTPFIPEGTPVIESQAQKITSMENISEPNVGTGDPARPLPTQLVNWLRDERSIIVKVENMIKSILFYTFPRKFSRLVKEVFSQAFVTHKEQLNGTDTVSEEIKTDQQKFEEFNTKLNKMGLMELLSGSAVAEIVHSQIEKHIEEECRGVFDTSFMKDLEQWLEAGVLGWLRSISVRGSPTTRLAGPASSLAGLTAFRDRLKHFLYERYGRSLIAQFFDVIIDFPDSKPAIQDLACCLEKTDLRAELVDSVRSALEARLLHPGVNTAVILTAYIAAIKSLRELEPAGVILELVCEPVGRYLRSREDTVRCIVASLTDDSNNELVSELVNTQPVTEDMEGEDGRMRPIWDGWEPDPVGAHTSSGSRFRRCADILSTLVNIYGSKELFVNEYRALLADRVLTQYKYDVERELRYMELLKLRFGESQLHFCDVMLLDVAESRRVNALIQDSCKQDKKEETTEGADKEEDPELSAMILSAQFWPAFREEKITLPSELQSHLDKYTRAFEQQKQNRTLVWKPHLGVMNIDLELNGETLNISVSPVQAAIIMKFQEKSEWSVDALAHDLEMTPSVLRRKLAFWQTQGLVRPHPENPGHFVLQEKRAGGSGVGGSAGSTVAMLDVEEEVESAMASAQHQKEQEMEVLWTYIQGMLANLESLTLERIHAMLRMFATQEPGSELTLQELKAFLNNKVKDQVLSFSSGVYRVNK